MVRLVKLLSFASLVSNSSLVSRASLVIHASLVSQVIARGLGIYSVIALFEGAYILTT